jgi:hypothetical protein
VIAVSLCGISPTAIRQPHFYTRSYLCLPLTPLTWIRYLSTGLLAPGRVQCIVIASFVIPARDTSGVSGTSTPSILMSSGTGFHRVSHARCSNLWMLTLAFQLGSVPEEFLQTRTARCKSPRTVRRTYFFQ